MSLDPQTFGRLPQVEGVLNYLGPMAEKPHRYTYDPPPGVPDTNAIYAPVRAPIYDLRPVAGALSLDAEGLLLLRSPSALRDFDDAVEVERIYYPEIERLVAETAGAERVVVFDHTIRRRLGREKDRAGGPSREPVPRVHNDYTEQSGPQRVRDLMGDEAEALLRRRFAVINVWRPIVAPMLDAPLAICDASSVAAEDFVTMDLLYRDRTGEIYVVRPNDRHRWLYAPAMAEDEVLLFKCYDSRKSGTARFAPHSAFEDPTAPEDRLPRASIEARALAFFAS